MGGHIDGQQHQQGSRWLLDDAGSFFSFLLWDEEEMNIFTVAPWNSWESFFPSGLILSDRS